jgi:general secretion pathway protein G
LIDIAHRSNRGLTYIELLVAVSVLAVLASAVIPLARWDDKRRREERLRGTLQMMRDAIDKYKQYCDNGVIVQTDVEQMCYPRTLEELAEGVETNDPNSPEKKIIKFLVRLPVDPITETPEWGLRSYQDDWDSEDWGEENVYDVYSLAPGIALDGTSYAEW